MTEQQKAFNPDQAAMDATNAISRETMTTFDWLTFTAVQEIISDTIEAALSHAEGEAVSVPPFATKIIEKLRRFDECAQDGEGADIGRHWFDILTRLGLLNRVQRSPALWELTQQGEDALEGYTHPAPQVRFSGTAEEHRDD